MMEGQTIPKQNVFHIKIQKRLQGNVKSYNNQTILITFNSIEATCQAGTLTSKYLRKGEGQATEVLVQRFIEDKETTSMLNVYMYYIVSLIGATTIYQDMQRLFNITLELFSNKGLIEYENELKKIT